MSCVERGTAGSDRMQPVGTSFHALRKSNTLVLEQSEDIAMRCRRITKAALVRGCGVRILMLLLVASLPRVRQLASAHETSRSAAWDGP